MGMDLVSEGLGAVVDALRRERGMRLRELAGRSGLREGYLWQVDWRRRWNPRLDTLEAVCRALGVDVSRVVRLVLCGGVCGGGKAGRGARPAGVGLPLYFGRAVRALRRRSGLSLSAVSGRTGMDKSNLSHVERRRGGRPVPTVEYMHLLAEGIGACSTPR